MSSTIQTPEEIMKHLTIYFSSQIGPESFSYDEVFCYIRRKEHDLFPHYFLMKILQYCYGTNLFISFAAEENVPIIAIRSNNSKN